MIIISTAIGIILGLVMIASEKNQQKRKQLEEDKIPHIKEIQERSAYGIDKFAPYSEVPKAFQELIKVHGFNPFKSQLGLICHENGPVEKGQDAKWTAVIITSVQDNKSSESKIVNLKEGKYLCCIHQGSYSTVSNTYEKIADFAEEHKLKVIDDAIEIYLNDPSRTKEDKLLTEVQMRIE